MSTSLQSTAAPPAAGSFGSNTFYTAPGLGAGVRGIELDRCYVGEYVAGRRHGFGTYTYPNSFFKYEGQWVNGKKHGLGRLSMRDGAYYEGEFVDGEIMGQGTRRFANGDVYIGSFEMGEMHGFGVMHLAYGDTYQGPLVHNVFQGVGVYTHAHGDVFEGDFVAHVRRGQGVLRAADGSRYEGGWEDNERSGQGECTYADGSWYKGSWVRSRYHGPGEWFQASTGLTYRGEFLEGQPAVAPSALNITWLLEEEPHKKARRPTGSTRGMAVNEGDAATPLPLVPGEPLPSALTIAAQRQELKPPPAEPSPPAVPEGKGRNKPLSAQPVGPVLTPVVNQPPRAGHLWRTAEMESGRQVNLTLHSEPPRPLAPGTALRARVVHTLMPDQTTRVRLLISTAVHLSPALPLARVGGQVVTSIQYELSAGQVVVEGLVLGAPEDLDRLSQPSGTGWLAVTSPERGGALEPGVCKVALPEPKVDPKKKGGK